MNSHHEIPSISRLAGPALISTELKKKLTTDLENSLQGWWPEDLNEYLMNSYRVDVRARYAGRELANPFGKGSGQLTMTPHQISEAADAGLGFAILKTVIAQDQSGQQSMSAWAIPEARMVVEPIHAVTSGRQGWTVTWKGRGWSRSCDDYRELFSVSLKIAEKSDLYIAPSVKFHLPGDLEGIWKTSEYEYVLGKLNGIWQSSSYAGQPMPIEKDFSPTLAGDDRSRHEEVIIRWLNEILPIMRKCSPSPLKIGMKLMNALGPIAFQERLLRHTLELNQSADFLVYGNRLFDPGRIFEDHCGVAYGGPDLSDRNIYVLEQCQNAIRKSKIEVSGTGDIGSGRTAVEYGMRGATSVQLHTYFQIPENDKTGSGVKRLRRKMARLIFDPATGLVAWLLHARFNWNMINKNEMTCWLDLGQLKLDQLQSAGN